MIAVEEVANKWVEKIGPVWEQDLTGNFRIPERTLGWHCIAWIMENLTNGEPGEAAAPFMVTPEQGRFILWWYALNEDGSFLYNEGQLQRLKGWGKDPLVCVISLFEALGDCRFAGYESDSKTVIAQPETLPLVGIAATTQEQTDSTMRLYKHYLTKECIRSNKIEINTESLKTFGTVIIRAISSNPEALEGKSYTFTIANESHHWHTNTAREMWKVIARNSVKVKGGTSRVLSITNAYDPNVGSVAQETREAYENQLSNLGDSKILYDSLEIAPDAPLFIFMGGEGGKDKVDVEASRIHISAMVDSVRGDSKWHDLNRIVDEFFDVRYPPDLNKRFWLNSIVSSEDAWIDVRDYDRCIINTKKADKVISKNDAIVMFFDGSKTDDSTVLVGCRISDGLVFKIAAWHKPPKGTLPTGMKWLVPRNAKDLKKYDFSETSSYNPFKNIETVDAAVDRAFRDYKVYGFFADPSHARDDIDNKVYWDSAIENWHIKYSKDLKVWAGNRNGIKSESINWDMIDSAKIEEFAEFAERTSEMILNHELLIEEDIDFRIHFKNAKIYKTKSGLESIWKGKKNSSNKIDLAVASIGALMVRSKYLKQFGEKKTVYNPMYRFG